MWATILPYSIVCDRLEACQIWAGSYRLFSPGFQVRQQKSNSKHTGLRPDSPAEASFGYSTSILPVNSHTELTLSISHATCPAVSCFKVQTKQPSKNRLISLLGGLSRYWITGNSDDYGRMHCLWRPSPNTATSKTENEKLVSMPASITETWMR